ncbi:hypothetical protein Bca4012_010137 [Brassica carinata]
MSHSKNPGSSSVSGGGNWRRRPVENQRGIPKFCRCGEEAVIKTSGTVKNPGRLFYCCPNGTNSICSLGLTNALSKRLRILRFCYRLKAELSEVKDDVVALEKKLEHRKVMTDMMRKAWCAIL